MKKITNPFAHIATADVYNCFGCSPANKKGLHLEFWEDGEEIIAKWKPRKEFEGWIGVLHGGIQATLMDEVAAWLVFVRLKTAGVTKRLKLDYLKPVFLSKGEISVRARLISFEKPDAIIDCDLTDGEGEICATARSDYFCFPEKIAMEKYKYPGADAFLAD